MQTVIAKIQVRRATALQWAAENPVLDVGEHGYETDTNQFKIGNGITSWNSLAGYFQLAATSQGLTTEQVQDIVGNMLVSGANTTVTYNDAGATITIAETTATTSETIQDVVGAMIASGTNVTVTYNDAGNAKTISSTGGPSSGLTLEEVQDAVGAMLTGGANTTISYNDGAATITVSETTAGITQEAIQDMLGSFVTAGSNVTVNYNDAGNVMTISATGGGSTVTTDYNALSFASPVVWAYNADSPNKKLTLTGNTSLDLTGTVDGDSGILIVTQDGTGGRTLSLSGNKETDKTISTGSGEVTALAFVNVGGNLLWFISTFGANVSTAEALQFTFWTGTAAESNGVWTGSANTVAGGKATVGLPANTDGLVYCQYKLASDNTLFGFDGSTTVSSSTQFDAAFNFHLGNCYVWEGAAYVNLGAAIENNYYGIRRTGNLLSLETSSDEQNWTSIHLFNFKSLIALNVLAYWTSDTVNVPILHYPKGVGLV